MNKRLQGRSGRKGSRARPVYRGPKPISHPPLAVGARVLPRHVREQYAAEVARLEACSDRTPIQENRLTELREVLTPREPTPEEETSHED